MGLSLVAAVGPSLAAAGASFKVVAVGLVGPSLIAIVDPSLTAAGASFEVVAVILVGPSLAAAGASFGEIELGSGKRGSLSFSDSVLVVL